MVIGVCRIWSVKIFTITNKSEWHWHIFHFQVWSWVLLFLWRWISRWSTDLSMRILGRRQFWRSSYSVSARIRAMGMGNLQFTPNDYGCVLRPREISTSINPEVPCGGFQSQRPSPLSIPTPVYRFLCRCHEGSPSAAMVGEVRFCD